MSSQLRTSFSNLIAWLAYAENSGSLDGLFV